MKIPLEKPALNNFKIFWATKMKNLDGGSELDTLHGEQNN